MDAVQPEDLRRAHAAIEQAQGAPTVLINAAGGNDAKVTVSAERAFEQISLQDWRANFDLNVVGGLLLGCQEFGPAMAARGKGSIDQYRQCFGPFAALARGDFPSAAKAAVLNLTLFLAREWAGKGVRVNSITPGFFPS